MEWRHGPGGERIRRVDYDGGADVITHEIGAAQIRYNGAVNAAQRSEVRRTAANTLVVQSRQSNGSYALHRQILLTDAQGSTYAVLGAMTLDPVEGPMPTSFDAWGLRRNIDQVGGVSPTPWSPDLLSMLRASTTRGYTGHEMAESVGIIHMNGRIYDPALGRFLQADPFVQSPGNSQSWNRYTYVFNNPLVYTDPSGYLGQRETMWLRTAAAVAITVYTGGAGTWGFMGMSANTAAGYSMSIAVVGGFAAGAIQTGSMRGAVAGGVSAGIFHGIGDYFSDLSGTALASAQPGTVAAARSLSHGVAGGIMASLQGGRFGHGFASSGFTAVATPGLQRMRDGPVRATMQAAVGGTASSLAGGKFANGAVTAAFSYAFSSVAPRGVGGQREGASEQGAVSLEVGGSRPLTEGEIAMSKDVFGDDIDYLVPRVFRRTYAPVGQRRGVAVAPNGNIYFHLSDYVDDFSAQGISGRAWFMHEMTHVWQHQQDVSVALRGIFNRRYEYLPLQPGKAFRSYGIEQQGDIVRDYYLLRQGYQVQGAPPISTYQSLLPLGR